MVEKYIMVSLEDKQTSALAEALGNKTCKKILIYLADKEACETEIARDLKLPANTVNYNIKKLIDASLIEKSKNFLWSVKGKKIIKYHVASKKIIISPKTRESVKSLLAAFLVTGIGSIIIRNYLKGQETVNIAMETVEDNMVVYGSEGVKQAMSTVSQTSPILFEVWIWFLIGGLVALTTYLLFNWRKF